MTKAMRDKEQDEKERKFPKVTRSDTHEAR